MLSKCSLDERSDIQRSIDASQEPFTSDALQEAQGDAKGVGWIERIDTHHWVVSE
jgi:hypothetical protein